MKALPTVQQLNDRFTYSPESGDLVWKNGRRKGKVAGTGVSGGYKAIRLDGCSILAHRLVWKMLKGEDPEQIDHVNGVRVDNRIENLRSVTAKQQARNRKRVSTNTSGIMGVYWIASRDVWEARIHTAGGMEWLGHFKCKLEAVSERLRAERKHNYHPNHNRVTV